MFQALRNLNNEVFQSERFIERQVSTHGGPKTKLVTFKDAIQLVMVLPGKVAKETRAQFASIIERYMAGDGSLHAEIEANAGSAAPIAQLARDSLGIQEAESDSVAIGMKRKREELELLKMEQEITAMMIENKTKEQTLIFSTTAELERIRDPTRSNLDGRTRLMIQDSLQNTLLLSNKSASGSGSGQLAIADSGSSNPPISIASVAAELGYRPTSDDYKRIGIDLRKRYIAVYGQPPPKHDQICDGRVTSVNSYFASDRRLVEASLHACLKPRAEAGGARQSRLTVTGVIELQV